MSTSPRAAAIVAELTLEEKACLLAGADFWSTTAVPRLGLPAMGLTDGPNGARGGSLPVAFGGEPIPSFCFPCGAALGATWDVEVIEAVGRAIGAETRSKAARILLAPTVNLHRSPLGGRNFESFSEDPLHAGRSGAAFVRGAQSQGVATTVKHFAGNESETVRFLSDSVVDERTLREVHLRPFELAVREGGALGIMTSYNRVNGDYCADNAELLSAILRGEWGFEGIVVTDWFAVATTERAIVAGLDLEMPGPGRAYGAALADAIRDGRVTESAVDAAATRLLSLFDRLGALDDAPTAPGVDGRPEHRAIARTAVTASIVMLENHGVLPLDVDRVQRVALIGPHAAALRIMGGGSASILTERPPRSLLDVLGERLPGVELRHEPGVDIELGTPTIPGDLVTAPDGTAGFEIQRFDVDDLGGVPRATVHQPDASWSTYGLSTPDAPLPYSAIGRGTLRVAEAGRYVLSLVHTGRAALHLDDVLVLDLRFDDLEAGHEYMGLARRERSIVVGLTPEQPVELRVEFWQEEPLFNHGFRLGLKTALPDDALDRAVEAASSADTVIVVVGATEEFDNEGVDRATTSLPGAQDELVSRVLEVAPHAIVVVNTGSVVSMPWASRTGALVQAWLGGEELADGLADVLTGEAEPGGRLPTTIPRRLEDSPTFGIDGTENGTVLYAERMLVGHRWYDFRSIDVAYPFGFGRSYTTFSFDAPHLSTDRITAEGTIDVTITVTNTGTRSGSEVVQVYVAPPVGPVHRPLRQLEAFAKVTLDPGESSDVTVTLDARSFAHWQPADPALDELVGRVQRTLPWATSPQGRQHSGWVVRRGTYEILVGRDSRTFDHSLTVDVPVTFAL